MQRRDAMRFVQACITAIEAGGYQECEDCETPIPDDMTYGENRIVLRFGNEEFEISIVKRRRNK